MRWLPSAAILFKNLIFSPERDATPLQLKSGTITKTPRVVSMKFPGREAAKKREKNEDPVLGQDFDREQEEAGDR